MCLNGTIQQQQQPQYWRNNPNLIKQLTSNNNNNNNNNNNYGSYQQQPMNNMMESYANQPQVHPSPAAPVMMTSNNHEQQSQQLVAERKSTPTGDSKGYIYANGYPMLVNNPPVVQVAVPPQPSPVVVAAPAPLPVAVPGPLPVAVPVPVGAYPIQQPVVSSQGDIIIENTIGGIPFDCRGRPTGHWRDTRFCDIFHACVHGYHRKTYACPIVGERTYFDEITKRCEFVSRNPAGCAVNVFLK